MRIPFILSKFQTQGRFLCVSASAFVIDLFLVAIIIFLTSVHVLFATALSFLTLAALAYLVHEFWTFSNASSRFSVKRLIGVISAAATGLTVRLILLSLLIALFPGAPRELQLGFVAAAAVGSLCVNYLLNRLIFRRGKSQI